MNFLVFKTIKNDINHTSGCINTVEKLQLIGSYAQYSMKTLNEFVKKRFKQLNALLKSFPPGNEKEALHQIRLEIKRIKAMLRLIHFNDKRFRDHKHFVPLRTIFRDTGKIRDAGLRQELLAQYTQIHSPSFRSPTSKLRDLTDKIPVHIKTVRKQRKIILREIKKIKSRTYGLYLYKKNKELDHLLAEGVTQKELHDLRKLIKEIIYLTSVKKKKNKIDPFLLQSAAHIGNWHDKKVLIPWIRTHASKEIATIKKLQSDSNLDMQNLRILIEERNKQNV